MNGQCQEIRSLGTMLPEERKHHIMALLTRMIHQRLTTSHLKTTEDASKKEHESHER